MVKSAVFIDRDGVINEEVDYLCKADETRIIPGCAEAIRQIHRAGALAVVVTNQSGIARKMYAVEDMMSVHARIQKLLLEQGAECAIDAFYFCPHHKEFTGDCCCRKPEPGMLLQAAKALNIDLAASIMIGDRISDLRAGRAAGCARSVLVKTGYGSNETGKAQQEGFYVAENLADAVKENLKNLLQ